LPGIPSPRDRRRRR